MDSPRPLIIGISGVSSSGKTTLSRLLRDIWPATFILHEDDFYWEDSQIPIKQFGDRKLQDWDCLEAIDTAKLQQCLEYIKVHGRAPPDLHSKEDQNSVGESGVDERLVQSWKTKASALAAKTAYNSIAIIDGFLLYSQAMKNVWDRLDLRLLLRTSFEVAKRRREARSGYVTIEGFWEDPPNYVDDVVWPNYVKDHQFLFENEDVDGAFNESVRQSMRIQAMPRRAEQDVNLCLDWACGIIEQELRLHDRRL